jgi:hypothetical protein
VIFSLRLLHKKSAEEQFGFRSGSTTDKAICKLINEAMNAISNKFIVRGNFFDLERLLTA